MTTLASLHACTEPSMPVHRWCAPLHRAHAWLVAPPLLVALVSGWAAIADLLLRIAAVLAFGALLAAAAAVVRRTTGQAICSWPPHDGPTLVRPGWAWTAVLLDIALAVALAALSVVSVGRWIAGGGYPSADGFPDAVTVFVLLPVTFAAWGVYRFAHHHAVEYLPLLSPDDQAAPRELADLGPADLGPNVLRELLDRAQQLGITSEQLDETVRDCAHALAARAYNDGDFPGLDDEEAHAAVHDRADVEASDAATGGVESQLRYLIAHYGAEATGRMLTALT